MYFDIDPPLLHPEIINKISFFSKNKQNKIVDITP